MSTSFSPSHFQDSSPPPPACLICTGQKILNQVCSGVDPVQNLRCLVGRRLVNAPVSRGHCLVAGHVELGPLLVESRATGTIRGSLPTHPRQ